MPIPTPTPNEDRVEFVQRCMMDENMMEEYPNVPQRFEICFITWKGNTQ